MPINTSCTGCGQLLTVAEEYATKQARCPSCGQIYTVPLRSTVTASGEPLTAEQLQGASDSFDFAGDRNSPTVQASTNPPTFAAPIITNLASTDTDSNKFWMRSPDHAIYGPVDRATLDRWFHEGRVGQGFEIRQGEQGPWQVASLYQSNGYQASQLTNPYAPTSTAALASGGQSSNGVMILVFGILSWFVCLGFGIAAMIMGRSALRDIDEGRADPSQRGLISVGFWLGTIHIVLIFGVFALWLLAVALAAISGGIR